MDDISSSPASPAQQLNSGKGHVVCESRTSTPFIPLHPPIVLGKQSTQSQAQQLEHSPWGTWPWSEPSIWGQDSCLASLQLARLKVSSCQRNQGIKAKEDCPPRHSALLPPCCLVAREVPSRAALSPSLPPCSTPWPRPSPLSFAGHLLSLAHPKPLARCVDSGLCASRPWSCHVTMGRSPNILSLCFYISKTGGTNTCSACSPRWMGGIL